MAHNPPVKRAEQFVGSMRFGGPHGFRFHAVQPSCRDVRRVRAHPGTGELDYPLDEKIEAVAFHNLPRLFPILG